MALGNNNKENPMPKLEMRATHNIATGKLTVITSTKPTTLGKTYKITANGVEKKTAGQMMMGFFEVRGFADAEALAAILVTIRTDQAIIASLPITVDVQGRIVTKAEKAKNPGALSRTKDDFHFPAAQPGVVILDYDPPAGCEAMSRESLRTLLQSFGVADCGLVWWCSGSSFIYHGEDEYSGLRGQRFYVMVSDMADTVRFGEVLAKRLWLAGKGRIAVSSSGQRLVRSVFDEAMFQPARLDFIGGAVAEPPLSQRRGSPVVLCNGGWLDTRIALPELTDRENSVYETTVDDAKAKAEPEACRAREEWKAARMDGEVKRLVALNVDADVAKERAERTLSSALGGVLFGDYPLTMQGGAVVTVGEILDKRDRYNGVCTLDPLEPEYLGGKIVGRLYLYGTQATLYSFAHGGATYRLRRQPARLYVSRGSKAQLADEIRDVLQKEPDLFIRGGILVRVEGRKVRGMRKAALLHYTQTRIAFYSRGKDGKDIPADLPADVVEMLIAISED